MKINFSVSVGICAYNEGNNIKNVLADIISQDISPGTIKEIIVVCGGCTDDTIAKVRSVKSKKIKILVNDKREGKANDQQKIHDVFTGTYLVLFDGDVRLKDKNTVKTLLGGFSDNSVALVGGNSQPYPPKTFFKRAVRSTFRVFYKSRLKIREGNNIFGCSGQIIAMTKHFAKSFRFPTDKPIINEDAYMYLVCMQNGLKFRYVNDAIVYFKLPSNVTDYIRQVYRSDPRAVTTELKRHFGDDVWKEFKRPGIFYIKSIIESFLEEPFGLVTIVIINFFCKLTIPVITRQYKLDWFTAQTTK